MKANNRTPLTLITQRTLGGRLMTGIPDDLPEEDAKYWVDHTDELHLKLKGLLILPRTAVLGASSKKWTDPIINRSRTIHKAQMGSDMDLTALQEVLLEVRETQVKTWKALGLGIYQFPRIVLSNTPDFKRPGFWKVIMEPWYWQRHQEGKIMIPNATGKLVAETEVVFGGIVALVDMRPKPMYTNGDQMLSNDGRFLGPIMRDLRKEKSIVDYNPVASRFNTSANETEIIRKSPSCLKIYNLPAEKIRLERIVEMNVTPQYLSKSSRAKDGATNTSVWCHEFFESASGRVEGGNADNGGLANVNYNNVDNHWNNRSFRFLGVLRTV